MKKIKTGCLLFLVVVALSQTGCVSTHGRIELKGKISDEYSKEIIPFRKIIIQALLEQNNKTTIIECGEVTTDSSGLFRYTLNKVRNARYYNFCFVGDSNYASSIKRMGLYEIQEHSKYLFFSMNKLTVVGIYINAESNNSICDTVYLTWESYNSGYKDLYPYEVENYGLQDNFMGQSALGLFWIGKNTKSLVKTRVYAGKMTKLKLELIRNNKSSLIRDTITCKRDINNRVYFKI